MIKLKMIDPLGSVIKDIEISESTNIERFKATFRFILESSDGSVFNYTTKEWIELPPDYDSPRLNNMEMIVDETVLFIKAPKGSKDFQTHGMINKNNLLFYLEDGYAVNYKLPEGSWKMLDWSDRLSSPQKMELLLTYPGLSGRDCLNIFIAESESDEYTQLLVKNGITHEWIVLIRT